MAYAGITDVKARIARTLSEEEEKICETLLEDAAVLVDSYNQEAKMEAKKVVSCRMVIRAIGDGETSDIPIGATQGSMSALGYSQSWTLANGATGELYLSKTEKKMLGVGNRIGSYSPLEDLTSDSLEVFLS